MYNIHLLPASFGDSILIEYGTTIKKYILIDGGPYFNFEHIMKAIKKIAPNLKALELLVITHVDIDHIDGTIMLLNQNKLPFAIKEIWFNGLAEMKQDDNDLLGVLQGDYVSVLIKDKKIAHNKSFGGKAAVVKDYKHLPEITLADGMRLTLLGPNREGLKKMQSKWEKESSIIEDEAAVKKRLEEDFRYDDEIDDLLGKQSIEEMQAMQVKGDDSEANGSSIAFLATYKGKSCLFTGDLFTEYLEQSIDALIKIKGGGKLNIDAWKLAHHGSKKSTLESMMKKIETKHILVSSDGKRYHHPDKETIAKLLKYHDSKLIFHFNYKTEFNEMWNDENLKATYKYEAKFPNDDNENGISLKL